MTSAINKVMTLAIVAMIILSLTGWILGACWLLIMPVLLR